VEGRHPAGTAVPGDYIEYWVSATDNGVPAATGSSISKYFEILTAELRPGYCTNFDTDDAGFFDGGLAGTWVWVLPVPAIRRLTAALTIGVQPRPEHTPRQQLWHVERANRSPRGPESHLDLLPLVCHRRGQ